MKLHRIIIAAILLLLVAGPAFAEWVPNPRPAERLQNVGVAAGYSSSVGTTSVATTVGQIIKTFLSLLGLIFMGYLVYAGYLWMSASGEEEKLRKAKAIIRGSIIGIIIALSGYIITATVVDRISTATGYGEAYHPTTKLGKL